VRSDEEQARAWRAKGLPYDGVNECNIAHYQTAQKPVSMSACHYSGLTRATPVSDVNVHRDIARKARFGDPATGVQLTFSQSWTSGSFAGLSRPPWPTGVAELLDAILVLRGLRERRCQQVD
jgi:hypothetical protein